MMFRVKEYRPGFIDSSKEKFVVENIATLEEAKNIAEHHYRSKNKWIEIFGCGHVPASIIWENEAEGIVAGKNAEGYQIYHIFSDDKEKEYEELFLEERKKELQRDVESFEGLLKEARLSLFNITKRLEFLQNERLNNSGRE